MADRIKDIKMISDSTIYFRVSVTKGAVCHFSYSTDGRNFTDVGEPFTAMPGRWIGAKIGLFCSSTTKTNDSGYADFDWLRIAPVND